jgi:glutamyl-tRNA synthetase/glutamyl-Q tRNA(Asp) synthetase
MIGPSTRIDGATLAGRVASRVPRPLTRFAPSPTGYLHIGHVVNAVFVWGLAQATGGRVLLRIEDHDRQRCRPELEAALLDDLDWLQFVPDLFPTAAFRAGRSDARQSDRAASYQSAAEALIARGLVYACDCSRRQVEGERYSGRCRDRGLPLSGAIGWRVRIDPGEITFDDLQRGVIVQSPAEECGDVLIRDRLGNWTYQFAVSVDDEQQQINLVIRGEDLIMSTSRQIFLSRLNGRAQVATYLHHPLVWKSDTQKVSKSDGDSGVRDLRLAGWEAQSVIGRAAWLAGLQASPEPLAAGDVRRLFGDHTDR